MGANPHANGGLLRKALGLPDFRDYAVPVEKPGIAEVGPTQILGQFLRDVDARQPEQLPCAQSGRERLQPPDRAL